MQYVIGIDPGGVTGVAVLGGTVHADILEAECFQDPQIAVAEVQRLMSVYPDAMVVIEWPRAYGLAGNDIADACALAGWFLGRLSPYSPAQSITRSITWLTRVQVCRKIGTQVGRSVKGKDVWKYLPVGMRSTAERADSACSKMLGKQADHARAAACVAYAMFI